MKLALRIRRGKRPASSVMSKSEQMARVRSRDTDAELVLRRALWHAGLRYRVLVRELPGTPDLVFMRARVAIFIDGCFWHGCPIHYREPKRNSWFWKEKLVRNQARDCRVDSELSEMGWAVVRLWEHDIYEDANELAARLKTTIHSLAPLPQFATSNSLA